MKPLLVLVLLLPAGLLLSQQAGAADYVEGEVIVTFKEGVSQERAGPALSTRSLRMTRRFERLSEKRGKTTGLVRQDGRTTQQLLSDLKKDPDVEMVEPNYLRRVSAAVPNDTRFAEQWALRNTGQSVDGVRGTSGADIDFLPARDMARTPDREVVIGIIDTGVDVVHPELSPVLWVNDREVAGNGIDEDGNGYIDDVNGFDFADNDSDPSDSGYHGTHVAGTVAALGNNSLGVVGVCDSSRILALKVSSNGSTIATSAVIEALEYATALKQRGVNIVALNASYGGSGNSTAERAAIQAAGNAGILLCVAAGNESSDNDETPTYPASYRLPSMIVVASTDQNDALSSFSNYGATTVDIAAPGTNILSTKPSSIGFKVGTTTYETNEITYGGVTTGLSGGIVDCGIGNVSEFPAGVRGNIALIQRGTLNFSTKVANAMAAGATAAIIYNNVSGNFNGTLQSSGLWIPARAISQADGLAIKASLPRSGSIVVTAGHQFLDGTSMAAPHVTAAAAFAAMNNPEETLAQRRQRIIQSAEVRTSLNGKVISKGRLNLMRVADGNQNGYADWYDQILANTPFFTTPAGLPVGIVNQSYHQALTIIGGVAPFTCSITAGALPEGLTLDNSGVISGTPAAIGSYTFTARVASGSFGSTQVFRLSITTLPPEITRLSPLPAGATGQDYDVTMTAAGATPPYVWSLSSGALPDGLEMNAAGKISGLPTTAGDYAFTLKVTDSLGLFSTSAFDVNIAASAFNITSTSPLPGAVLGVPYSERLSSEGGVAPLAWGLRSGSLPGGLILQADGTLAGTPEATGLFQFVLEVMDALGAVTARRFTCHVYTTWQVPVVNQVLLGSTTIGAPYNKAITARNYPTSYSITGLPPGLSYVVGTGVISGRPRSRGTFQVKIRGANKAGVSTTVTAPLTVLPLDGNLVGSFTGLMERNASANQGLGSRLSLTTTTTGAYTVRVTTGSTARAVTGFMDSTLPQIRTQVAGSLLTLSLDSESHLVVGSHGPASLTGWRQGWHALSKPATSRAGYYTFGLSLADARDDGVLTVPQGTGYAAFTLTTGGTLTIVGRTADGQGITCAGFMGPGGELLLHAPLYQNLGSITGLLALQSGATSADNEVSGPLTWSKPRNVSRAYGAGFALLNLDAYGRWLAPRSFGFTALGLPAAGPVSLWFTDAGLDLASRDPDVSALSWTDTFKVVMPKAGTEANPAGATLSINKASGAITGAFNLLDDRVSRRVVFNGLVIRGRDATLKAAGCFLLPQLPKEGEKAGTTPILSGGVELRQ